MDRIDRRGFLECMAWAGTGVLWTAAGGVVSSRLISSAEAAEGAAASFSFVQISDTHIGFKGQDNGDHTPPFQQVAERATGRHPRQALDPHPGGQTSGRTATGSGRTPLL